MKGVSNGLDDHLQLVSNCNEQTVSMFPIFCLCQDLECNSYLYHQRKRCCNHQSSCLLSGLRQRSAFLLHSVLERFLSTCKAIKFFFCRGKILSRRTSQVLIFLPNCGFFLWVCYVPIGEWQSICNDWMLNGHHCAFSKWNNNFNKEKHGRWKKLKLSSYNHLCIFSCLIGRLSWHDCFSESDGTWWKWFSWKCSEWPHTFWGSGTP